MSISGIFDIGKSAIFASQTALSVTSNNIANVNTSGFSRQEVILSIGYSQSIRGGSLGTGVTIEGIRRFYDSFIQSQLIGQNQNQGRSLVLNQSLSQIEQIFNEAKGLGMGSYLDAYFAAWQELSLNPEGEPQRNMLIQKANILVNVAQQMERGITDNLRQLNQKIDSVVNRINTLASDIGSLNGRIVELEKGVNMESANSLRDQRDTMLAELSNLAEISYFEDDNGSVNVSLGMRILISGEMTNSLSSPATGDQERALFLDNVNITDLVNRGQLGGLRAAISSIKTDSLQSLRRLVASLTKEVNLVHRAGYGLDASTGNDFFKALQVAARDYSASADVASSMISDYTQLTLDEYDITFAAGGNYSIVNRSTGTTTGGVYAGPGNPITFDGITIDFTGTPLSGESFFVSPLTNAIANFGVAVAGAEKIAAASSNTTLPGDNTNAVALAQLAELSVADLGNSGFFEYYRDIVSIAGTMSRASSDSLKFEENLLSEFQNRRESVSGVSLDEEAANLVRYQRSYEAGARMIRVADELLQTLLNL
ncbi:MAG: flagellar hook-associated protein FlgK [Nitrospirae bacterium]|nr:flagellar hook-associated protein FlgK [Nitrospirota bacterium]